MKTRMMMLLLTGFLSTHAMANGDTVLIASGNSLTPSDTTSILHNDFILQEEIAQFPGGDTALENYFLAEIDYPAQAKNHGIEGKVVVSFIINEYGMVENLNILQSISKLCDDEVLNAIANMPRWKPAMQAGHVIRTRKVIGINFKL